MLEALIRMLAAILGDDHSVVTLLQRVQTSELPEDATDEQRAQAIVAALEPLNDEELADLERGLVEIAANDEIEINLDGLREVADVVDVVRAEQGRREEVAAAEAEARDAELRRIRGEQTDPGEEGGEGEGDEGAGEGEGQQEGAEGDGAGEGQEGGQPAEGAEGAGEREPEPVTAASPPAVRRPSIRRVATRGLPASRQPRTPAEAQARITITEGVSGFAAGQQVNDSEELANALVARQRTFRGDHRGPAVYATVATLHADYPTERQLGADADANSDRIMQAIREASGQPVEALVAAGGLCAPVTPLYAQPVLAVADRPVRDGLPSFQATRDGITFVPPPAFPGTLATGVSEWTADNDADPSNPATKPCVTIDCEDAVTVEIAAITQCLQIGNFLDRSFRERVDAFISNLNAVHAQTAEGILIDAIENGSTAVTGTDVGVGAARNVLYNIGLAGVAYRDRHRMPEGAVLDLWIPRWLRAAMVADLMLEIPGAAAERLAVANAEIDRFMTARNFRLLTFWDRQGISAAQAAGNINNWPTNATVFIHPPGTFLFLDGGTLDLGVVRDADLVGTNDFRIFSETFEAIADLGHEALALTIPTCITGEVAGTVDIACQGS